MSLVILDLKGCWRQQMQSRKNKSSKSCFCLEFCWQFCGYFLKHQQNNIFRLFLFHFKYSLDATGGTWRTVINPVLQSLVCVVQTQLQGVKLLVSKPPLCLCSPEGTFGAVGHGAFQMPRSPPFSKHSQHKHSTQRHPGGGKMRFSEVWWVGWSPEWRFLSEA